MDAAISFELPTTARIGQPGYRVISPADRFLKAMETATGFDQLLLAERAIRRDPGCVEARLVLAEHSRDLTTRLRHLEAAVNAGEWLWSPVADHPGSDLCWWYDVETRPYMRAVQALGLTLWEAGYTEESRACFARLLVMDPRDAQGIRHLIQEPGNGPGFR